MSTVPVNDLRQTSRLITTHNSEGKAVFSEKLSDDLERKLLPDGAATFALAWTSNGFPVNFNEDQDVEDYSKYLHNPPGITLSNGTVLRMVDMAPGVLSPMHRTISLDYGIVLEGEVWLELDSGERKLMKRGDCSIQRGTNHAWRNNSETSWARMMYVLQPASPLEVGGKKLGEDYGTMVGVRPSD